MVVAAKGNNELKLQVEGLKKLNQVKDAKRLKFSQELVNELVDVSQVKLLKAMDEAKELGEEQLEQIKSENINLQKENNSLLIELKTVKSKNSIKALVIDALDSFN